MGKFRAPSWAMKITRCVEQQSSKYINCKLPFTMSNWVEGFKHVASLDLHNAVSMCSYYITRYVQHVHTSTVNDPLPIVLFKVQLLSIWSTFHYFPSSNLETGNICPIEYEIVKLGTDTNKYGNWFSKYQKTCQLFSLSSYATWKNLMITCT